VSAANAPCSERSLKLGSELERRVVELWWQLSRQAPGDISRTSASVLAGLRGDGPQRITTLAERERVAQPTMTTLVQRLERDGLVARQDDPDDKRACRIAVTDSGLQALQQRAAKRAHWLGELLEQLSEPERAAIADALDALDSVIAKGTPPQ